ncbi:hypothetical protein D3C72_1607730 [compost metagenome]
MCSTSLMVPVLLLAGMARARRMAGGKAESASAAAPVVAVLVRKLRREFMGVSCLPDMGGVFLRVASGRAAHLGLDAGVGRGRGARGRHDDRGAAAAIAAAAGGQDAGQHQCNGEPCGRGQEGESAHGEVLWNRRYGEEGHGARVDSGCPDLKRLASSSLVSARFQTAKSLKSIAPRGELLSRW